MLKTTFENHWGIVILVRLAVSVYFCHFFKYLANRVTEIGKLAGTDKLG